MAHIKRDQHDIYPFISAKHRLAGSAAGKSVIVTGGGKGVGRAIAKEFAQAGATKLLITGRDAPALQEAKSIIEAACPHCTVTPVPADVTTEAAVNAIFAALSPSDPPPDILVNNAGINADFHIADSDPARWWRDWEVNVLGTYLCTRAYLRLLAGGPGTILNVSTCIADFVLPNMSSYATSKMAVNRLTQCTQLEYGAQGIRCLAFHPGGIASTGMGQRAPAQFRGTLLDTPELAAGTALYLSSEGAAYLNGRMVFSDWNMEELEKIREKIVREDLLVMKTNYGDAISTEIVFPQKM